jgi:hypothetical protein
MMMMRSKEESEIEFHLDVDLLMFGCCEIIKNWQVAHCENIKFQIDLTQSFDEISRVFIFLQYFYIFYTIHKY